MSETRRTTPSTGRPLTTCLVHSTISGTGMTSTRRQRILQLYHDIMEARSRARMSELDGKCLAALHRAARQLDAVHSCIANFRPRLRARFCHRLLQASHRQFGKSHSSTLCNTHETRPGSLDPEQNPKPQPQMTKLLLRSLNSKLNIYRHLPSIPGAVCSS